MYDKVKVFVAMLAALAVACWSFSPALAKDAIVLGAPLATEFLYGWDAERAIKLAVGEINAAGGVKVGKESLPLQVEVLNTRDLEPTVPVSEVITGMEKLILNKKVNFIVGGPVRSEAALAALPLLAQHKIVSILSTGALTPMYHKLVAESPDKFKYCFRISGEAGWMVMGEVVPCLEQIRKEFGLSRMIIMVQDVTHARTGGVLLTKVLSKKGWRMPQHPVVFPTGTNDFSKGLLQAKRLKSEVIVIWMDMPETSTLLKQWHDMKIEALPFGTIISAAEQPGFWNATEGKGEYCLANVVNAGNAPSKVTPWTERFVEAYKAHYGLEPEGYGTSSSYMAVYVLKDAIERAGSLDPEKVVDALKTTDMMGVYGRIRFDPKSNQITPSLDPNEGAVGTIFQWQAGSRVVVFPPKIATGKILLPPWMRR